MRFRFEDNLRSSARLAQRVVTLITYGLSKKDVVDKCRENGYSDDEILLAYVSAKMMSEKKRMGTRRRPSTASGEGET